ncbi:hypothetical protein Tco_0427719, partial [Tanacetum coccineum]
DNIVLHDNIVLYDNTVLHDNTVLQDNNVSEQLMAWSGMDMKMAKTCYHSHWDGMVDKGLKVDGAFNVDKVLVIGSLIKPANDSLVREDDGLVR